MRCQLVLLKADGRTSQDVGRVVGLCHVSVSSWTKRHREAGLEGLKTKPGRGRKPRLAVAQDEAAVRAAVQSNRQRITLAKAAWEAQRASGSPAVGRDTFCAFLKALVADSNASVAG
ncbi:helix-turn-helix domain-containing protein [Hymenobacter elongatus]|uniref:helix-turn-helix domain-containing protein n=1 Tax=Hymenobacter elongatus TaxID=877208 RepID=UPI0037440B87